MILKYFCPDYRVKSIYDISPKWLKRNGYMKLVVDIDNTFVARDKTLVSPRFHTWVRQLHQLGINIALISNNTGERIDKIIRQTNLGGVTRAGKPLPVAYKRITEAMGGGKILFIGDQLMTDVLGAKWSGHPVIWVESMGGKELWITRMNRKIESFIANRLTEKNMMPKERILQ